MSSLKTSNFLQHFSMKELYLPSLEYHLYFVCTLLACHPHIFNVFHFLVHFVFGHVSYFPLCQPLIEYFHTQNY